MLIPPEVQNVIDQGGLIFASHSGGKDSQAMFALLASVVPADQLVVVHADLGQVEWVGVQDHIRSTIGARALHVTRAIHKDGSPKDFFSMIRARRASLDAQGKLFAPAFPSAATRQCTSDLKTGPIHKLIRRLMAERGTLLAVNATGIRAQESAARSKKAPLKLNAKLSKAGRSVWDWLPIFDMTTVEVFATIANAGQDPFWAYQENERLSCVFCIMGSVNDLQHGARQRPELLDAITQLEQDVRSTMFNGQSLLERTGSTAPSSCSGCPCAA